MADQTAELLAQRALNFRLLDEHQLQEVWGHFGRRNVPSAEFQTYLLRRQLLTNWQLERLIKADDPSDDPIFFCGDYKLLYLAGTGTFSRVYRAVNMHTGDMAAVKVLRRRYSDKSDQVDQFHREGKVGLMLRHPNIVTVLDVYGKGSLHYIVMEFVEGQNLREFVKLRKKFDPAAATEMMIGIASGLSYAFNQGITHRDLKLTNVLVSSQAVPKLVDFGLAGVGDKLHSESKEKEKESPAPRTVDYVGLERASGAKRDDLRSDIFFAGCIYYHLLTGHAPLAETRERIQRLSKSRYTDVTPILKLEPSLPKGVAAIVARAMEISPHLRYQTPGEMLAELQLVERRLAEGADVVDQPASGGQDASMLFDLWEEKAEQVQRAVMVVESNVQMQDVLRTGLKRIGYRVLLTRDPERALDRFRQNAAADCIVFSTVELGEASLHAFNEFGKTDETRKIPAVLLLGEGHKDWVPQVRLGDHRLILQSPIKMKDFRQTLYRLVPPTGQAGQPREVERPDSA